MMTRETVGKLRQEESWRLYLLYRSLPHRDRLVQAYLPLVRHAAGRLKDKLPGSIDILDLISAGQIGLIKAVENFQTAFGVKFETYCNMRIRGAILDDLREQDWVPRLLRARANRLRRTREALAFELGREPNHEEVASGLGVSMKRYYALLDEVHVRHQVSIEGDLAKELGVKRNGDDSTGEEILPDPRQEPPLERLEREEIRKIALKGLSPKERVIIDMHYFEGRNMKEIGKRLGISSSRVCQIHTRVMRLLRQRFLSEPYRDWCPQLAGRGELVQRAEMAQRTVSPPSARRGSTTSLRAKGAPAGGALSPPRGERKAYRDSRLSIGGRAHARVERRRASA